MNWQSFIQCATRSYSRHHSSTPSIPSIPIHMLLATHSLGSLATAHRITYQLLNRVSVFWRLSVPLNHVFVHIINCVGIKHNVLMAPKQLRNGSHIKLWSSAASESTGSEQWMHTSGTVAELSLVSLLSSHRFFVYLFHANYQTIRISLTENFIWNSSNIFNAFQYKFWFTQRFVIGI